MACASNSGACAGAGEAYRPAGTSMCGMSGCTVRLQLDPANCGSCGRARRPTSASTASARSPVVPHPLHADARRRRPRRRRRGRARGLLRRHPVRPANCGRCGNACAAHEERCESGACRLRCPMGQIECTGQCVDRCTDARNCGFCGRVRRGPGLRGRRRRRRAELRRHVRGALLRVRGGGRPAPLRQPPGRRGQLRRCRRRVPGGPGVASAGCAGLPCPGQLACPTAPTACVDPRVDPPTAAPAAASATRRRAAPRRVLRGHHHGDRGLPAGARRAARAARRRSCCATGSRRRRASPSGPRGLPGAGAAAREQPPRGLRRAARWPSSRAPRARRSRTTLQLRPRRHGLAPLLGTSTANWADAAFAPPVRASRRAHPTPRAAAAGLPRLAVPGAVHRPRRHLRLPGGDVDAFADDNSSPSADPFSGGFRGSRAARRARASSRSRPPRPGLRGLSSPTPAGCGLTRAARPPQRQPGATAARRSSA